MCILTQKHAHGRGTREALGLDVPADPCEHGVARGREADEARHRGAGDESHGALARQPQDVEQPARGHLLGHGRRGGAGIGSGVLSPRAGQHVRGNADRMRCADHPAKEACPGATGQSRIGGGIERIEGAQRLLAEFGCRAIEQRLQFGGRDDGPGRAI